MKKILAAAAFIAFATSGAFAQSYSIDWYTIDGGGGTSTGGVYSVSGTIGQPDAGTMTGGSFTLAGGFWSVINLVQIPGAPLLRAQNLPGGLVRVSWPVAADGFVLDQASALASPPGTSSWSQVGFPYQTNSSEISITVPPNGVRFYRLRKP